MVGQISELLSGTGILQKTLRQLQVGEKELLEEQATLAPATLKATTDTLDLSREAKSLSGSDMMSGNFAGGRENGSTYIDAQTAGLKASKQIRTQAASRVSGLLNSLGGIKMGEGSDHTPAWYKMQMRRIQNAESSEASEKNLDEMKDNIERKAQEVVAATDADGNPVERSVGTGQAAPMPEISGSNPAPTSDAAASLAVDSTPTPAPKVSAPAASPTPAIDITV